MNYHITRNPYTLEEFNTYPYESLEQVQAKIEKARNAFRIWKNVSISERVAAIRNGLTYFEENCEGIARDITRQMGKPLAQSHNEIESFFERAHYLCNIAEKTLSPDILPEKTHFYRRIDHIPLGVVFIIAAWNYPLLIAVNGVVTALLAGNTVLLKHSGLTTSIGTHFENSLKKHGSWDNLLHHVVITHDVAQRIIETKNIDHVIFTGSVKGGKAIKQSTAYSFMDCNLELGGKDAAYVAPDTDILKAADGLVEGAMYNAGQSCCGIERVYVHENIYSEFVEKCCTLVDRYKLGDPMEPATTMGPLPTVNAAKMMMEQIRDAIHNGAKIERGGHTRKIGNGTFMEPTILTNVKHTMRVMQEENFGPIMPIMKVKDMDEAIDFINDSKYGLTAAIYTSSEDLANQFSERIDTGTVFMNRCDYLDPALPWTGVKESGKGSTLSKYGFYALTRKKAIHFRTKF
ncbi:MAG: aldehyde dehydrogenase family protein [Nitrospinota bacterium]